MRAHAVVRDGVTGGASFDVIDDGGRRVGRVDIVGPLPSGRRFWERYDANDSWEREGEFTAGDAGMPDEQLVIDVWQRR